MLGLDLSPMRSLNQLDDDLRAVGQMVTVRRGAGDVAEFSAAARAFVRKAKPELLAAGVSQDSTALVLSPSDFGGWDVLPCKGDFVRIANGPAAVIVAAEVVRIDDVPVRINLMVEG